MLRHTLFIAVCIALFSQVLAFAPASPRAMTFRPASSIPGAKPTNAFVLRMADEETEAVSKIDADGTFYDDEVDSAPVKQGISDSMRARLIAEASTGLDSEAKQTNVLLYIIGAVAVLVVLGGAGIFY